VSHLKKRQAIGDGVMVGTMYLPSATELVLAQPPMYLMSGRGAPMQLAADAAPIRRLCDVHLKPVGADVLIVRSARVSQVESVAAALQSAEASKCERLQKASGWGALVVGRAESHALLCIVVHEVR
jgi:hypothetical protein